MHGRSLAVNPMRKNRRDLLVQIRERRESMPYIVKEEELKKIIEEGRA